MYKILHKKECHYDGVIELNLKIVTSTKDRSFLPDIMDKAFAAGAETTKRILLKHPQISHALVTEASVVLMAGEEDSNIKKVPEASSKETSTYVSTDVQIGGWSHE